MPTWVYFSFLCLAGAGLAFIADRYRPLGWQLWSFVGLAACVTLIAELDRASTPTRAQLGDLPARAPEDGYLGSETCRSCHPAPYESWHRSYHRTMTQLVSPKTALAPFDGTEHEHNGRRYRFFQEEEELFAEVTRRAANNDQLTTRMKVVMSTGSHHYQLYWGAVDAFSEPLEIPLYWNIKEQRWIPKSDTTITPPGAADGPGHWNSHCIRCHSLNGKPGFVSNEARYESRVSEFGITCEACHGPGEAHVEKHRSPAARYAAHFGEADTSIVNPAKLDARASSHVCARCHGNYKQDMERMVLSGFPYTAGEDLEEVVVFHDADDPMPGSEEYAQTQSWRDGTSRTGGDEFNAHMKSPCYQAGELSCISCHSLHDSDPNDQLGAGMDGNRACLQCHESFEKDLQAHTHHDPSSPGSACYNCHMPHTSFALSTAMRSHRIDSPDVQSSAQTGRPNACNLCHLDKSLEWAGQFMGEWYDADPPELTVEQQTIAASVLWLLKGDAVQRAVAAWHMKWDPARRASGSDWQAGLLAELLVDPYAQVRYLASESLEPLPGFDGFAFDFIGGEEHYRDGYADAIERWQAARQHDAGAQPSVLVSRGGTDRASIARLLAERDNTPIDLPE